MPFEPRLIPPDDAPLLPSGEIDLPADLAALGEQLRDDALHLAVRYPAAGQPPALPVRGRRWKRTALLATAAATLLAGFVAVQVSVSNKATPKIAEKPASGPPAAVPAAAAVPAVGMPTAVSLTELSGPELEALMDLWQREPSHKEDSGVSF